MLCACVGEGGGGVRGGGELVVAGGSAGGINPLMPMHLQWEHIF